MKAKAKPYSHHEWTKKFRKSAMPCTAWDITYGGECFNCGYSPERAEHEAANRNTPNKEG